MKKYLYIIVMLLVIAMTVPVNMPAQSCQTLVTFDSTNTLQTNLPLVKAGLALVDEGILPHIVVIDSMSSYGNTLIAVEKSFEKRCPDWVGPNGVRKENLLVFIVSVQDRKKNVFFGGALDDAFQDKEAVRALFNHAAKPAFRNADWAGGTAQALYDFKGKIVVYHDQNPNPLVATTTTIKQVADPHGFYVFFYWLLFLSATGVIAWILFRWPALRHEEHTHRTSARFFAIQARDRGGSSSYKARFTQDAQQFAPTLAPSNYLKDAAGDDILVALK